MAESLCHPAETIAALLVGCIQYQGKSYSVNPWEENCRLVRQTHLSSLSGIPAAPPSAAALQGSSAHLNKALPVSPQSRRPPSGRRCFSPVILGVLKGPKRQLPLQIRELPQGEATSSVVAHKITA